MNKGTQGERTEVNDPSCRGRTSGVRRADRFWCVEAVYQTVPGILSVTSG